MLKSEDDIMNIKRALTVIIAASMICSTLVGCAQNNAEPVDASTKAASTEEVTQSQSTEPSTTQKIEDSTKDTAESTEQSTTAVTTTTKPTSTTKPTGTTKAATTRSIKGTTKKSTAKKTTAKTTKKATVKKVTTTASKTTAAVSTTKQETDIKITLGKNGSATCNSQNVSINAPSGLETDGAVYIEKGGSYVITSSVDAWHGQIVIKLANTEQADIRFENVNIATKKANAIKILDTNITAERSFIEADLSVTSSTGTDGDNALQDQMKEVAKIQKAPNVDLSFPTGTKSTFKTGANSMSGVIYNESKLTIKGNGAVEITATTNRNNTICSTKSVTFKNVNALLTTPGYGSASALSSARGIFSFSKVIVESGNLTIHSNGDGVRCEEFISSGGVTNIHSTASDGIDADDAINVTGGKLTAIALNKSAFKVRRVNNQESINAGDKKIEAKDGITKADHTFKIDGGTVAGEGKNMTTPKKRSDLQSLSKQPCIYLRSAAPGTENAKLALVFNIYANNSVFASSSNSCIKFLYSSSSIDTSKKYTVNGHNKKDYPGEVVFSGSFGDCKVTTV